MLFLQSEEAPHGNELESEKGMLQGLSAQRAGGAGGDMVKMGRYIWCFACRKWVANYQEHIRTPEHEAAAAASVQRMEER
jgi:hypothetical protein